MENTPITFILIGLNVIISFYAFNRPDIKSALMMNPYRIKRLGQYYRFITSGFIHQHHMHLLVNMFSFYFFGTAIEQILVSCLVQQTTFISSRYIYWRSSFLICLPTSNKKTIQATIHWVHPVEWQQ